MIFYFLLNYVYLSNVYLFDDLMLTEKNREKLRRYFNND